jgi:ABC-type multidrug transport system permease subunit
MKIFGKTAGSLVLASASLALSIVAGLLMLFAWGDLAVVLLWVVLPFLMLFTLCYLIADLVSTSKRRQGLFALLVSVPAFALQVWFFATLRL